MAEAFLLGIGGGGPSTVLSAVTLSSNGTYSANQFGIDGFDQVTVDVPLSVLAFDDNTKYFLKILSSYTNSELSVINSSTFKDQKLLDVFNAVNVTSIGSDAFRSCSMLKTAYFPNCVSMQSTAFIDCLLLSNLTLGTNIYGNFSGCMLLESLYNVRSIYGSGLYNCYALSSIVFASDGNISLNGAFYTACMSVFNMSERLSNTQGGLFAGCKGLITVSITGSGSISYQFFSGLWNTLDVYAPNLVGNDNNQVQFSGYTYGTLLTKVIANSIKYINFYSQSLLSYVECNNAIGVTIASCARIISATLPKVLTISQGTFSSTNNLRVVKLYCSNIQNYAFSSKAYLSKVYLLSNAVCTLANSSAFYNTPFWPGFGLYGISELHGSFYVPSSLVDSYKASNVWSYFASMIFATDEE